MALLFRHNEKKRFQETFADELMEYYFEQLLGENQHNGKPWRVILEERIEPHAGILCDFSKWLLLRGWNRETVEKLFVVSVDNEEHPPIQSQKRRGLRKFFSMFRVEEK